MDRLLLINDTVLFTNRSNNRILLEPHFFDDSETDKARSLIFYLFLYVPPVLLFAGLIGNVLAFIVLKRFSGKNPIYHYLYVLAAMDIMVLITGLLKVWINHIKGTGLEDISDVSCKLLIFFGFFSSDTSVWLLVAVSIDRSIAVNVPLKTTRVCTHKRTRISIVLIFIAGILINAHFLWSMEVQFNDSPYMHIKQVCSLTQQYGQIISKIWPWIDAVIYSLGPFITICTANIITVKGICASRKMFFEGSIGTVSQPNRSIYKNYKFTIMLSALSFSFLVLTLPMNVMMIVAIFWDNGDQSLEEFNTMRIMTNIAELLMYTNHAINFLLYFWSGSQFRKQFYQTFCPRYNKETRRRSSDKGQIDGPFSLLLFTSKKDSTTSYII